MKTFVKTFRGKISYKKIDKYVDLNKTVYMECIYTPKFKRWIPDKILKPCKTTRLCDVGNLIRDYKRRF